MFRTVSRTAIEYRDSALSTGAAGKVRGGDRLPWVALDAYLAGHRDNFGPLTSIDWQVHVYGEASPAVASVCRAAPLALPSFPWQDAIHAAGLVRDALYLVRPDGYIGLVDRDANAAGLRKYLDDWRLKARDSVTAPSHEA